MDLFSIYKYHLGPLIKTTIGFSFSSLLGLLRGVVELPRKFYLFILFVFISSSSRGGPSLAHWPGQLNARLGACPPHGPALALLTRESHWASCCLCEPTLTTGNLPVARESSPNQLPCLRHGEPHWRSLRLVRVPHQRAK